MKVTQVFLASLGALLAVSCASKEKKVCPTEADEPVSACRAQENCRGSASGVGVGVGLGLGNFGLGLGRSTSASNYADCIDKDMAEQKAKSQKSTEAAP
ncbi:MAG: hypothetical protein KF681_10595 [Bdellovibrionaceae bacterium]|nr:hypothetical protein [Pseudobdellovibrionaceae bacterium]